MSADLSDVKGLGLASVEDLIAHGIHSVEALARMQPSELAAIPGFGELRAARVIAAAASLARDSAGEAPGPETAADPGASPGPLGGDGKADSGSRKQGKKHKKGKKAKGKKDESGKKDRKKKAKKKK